MIFCMVGLGPAGQLMGLCFRREHPSCCHGYYSCKHAWSYRISGYKSKFRYQYLEVPIYVRVWIGFLPLGEAPVPANFWNFHWVDNSDCWSLLQTTPESTITWNIISNNNTSLKAKLVWSERKGNAWETEVKRKWKTNTVSCQVDTKTLRMGF